MADLVRGDGVAERLLRMRLCRQSERIYSNRNFARLHRQPEAISIRARSSANGKPGVEILLKASSDTSEMPIPYSALPKTGYNQSHIYRNLVAELNEGPGIWKWPPTNPGLTLKSGMNDVRIEVATVAPELAGESIMLLIHPEIGFKTCGSQVCWLWGWFAWPFFLLVQLIWASALFKSVPKTTK
jgi:hypothetical protein